MTKFKTLALGAAFAVAFAFAAHTGAFAGEEAPTAAPAKPAVETTEAAPEAVKTKTETPVCSMVGYIMEQVVKTPCENEGCKVSAMKAWFAGDAKVPMAGLRDRLKADGWTADSTIAFFKKMAAERGCDKADGECCGSCDKAAGDCQGCDKAAGGCQGCDKEGGKCCGGCDKGADKPAPANPAEIDG